MRGSRGRAGWIGMVPAVVAVVVSADAGARSSSAAPAYTTYDNLVPPAATAEVTRRAEEVLRSQVALGLAPGGEVVSSEGSTRFRYIAARFRPMDFSIAAAVLRDVIRRADRMRVPNVEDDLLWLDAMRGDPGGQTITAYVHLGGMLDEDAAFPMMVGFGDAAESGGQAATFRFRGVRGFVRELAMDIVLIPCPERWGTIQVLRFDVRTDWRGAFVSKRMFADEIVRKLNLLADSMAFSPNTPASR